MRPSRVASVLAAPLACLIPCSCSQGPSPSAFGDASAMSPIPDASAKPDANACVAEAGPGVPCAQSLASYCADGGGFFAGTCGSTWQDVVAHPPSCDPGDGLQMTVTSCGGVGTLAAGAIDGASIAVYDTATGALVALVAVENPGVTVCTAGPACFTWPSCTPQVLACVAQDAGSAADGGGVVDAIAD